MTTANDRDDELCGGSGSDILVGGKGNDYLNGTDRTGITDGEEDIFYFEYGDGSDVIEGFEFGIDKIYLDFGYDIAAYGLTYPVIDEEEEPIFSFYDENNGCVIELQDDFGLHNRILIFDAYITQDDFVFV